MITQKSVLDSMQQITVYFYSNQSYFLADVSEAKSCLKIQLFSHQTNLCTLKSLNINQDGRNMISNG